MLVCLAGKICDLEHTNTVKFMNKTIFKQNECNPGSFLLLTCFDLFSAVILMCNKKAKNIWIENRKQCLADQQKWVN